MLLGNPERSRVVQKPRTIVGSWQNTAERYVTMPYTYCSRTCCRWELESTTKQRSRKLICLQTFLSNLIGLVDENEVCNARMRSADLSEAASYLERQHELRAPPTACGFD